MYPSLFTACTVVVTFANFTFLGFAAHRLWRRDEEQRQLLVSAITKLYTDQTVQNMNMCDALQKNLTFNHHNITTALATIQHNNNELQKTHEAALTKILADSQTANQLLAQTLKPVIDWVYISESYVREFRMLKNMKTARQKTGGDVCGHCRKQVTEYFIDGAGRTTCQNCKPEGFRDAVDRGIVTTLNG